MEQFAYKFSDESNLPGKGSGNLSELNLGRPIARPFL